MARATKSRTKAKTATRKSAGRSTAARKAAATRKATARKASANRSGTARKTATRKTAASKTTTRKTAARGTTARSNGAANGRATNGRATVATSVNKPSTLGTALTVIESKVAKELLTALAVQPTPEDAIEMLKLDHRKVEELFEEFENTQAKQMKQQIAAKICLELRVHTQLEEELLYPDAHHEIEHDLVDEAVVEHASAKDLIAQIEASSPDDHLYDAKMKVLKEYVKHHVEEEEKEMFPKLKGHGLDFHEMAEQMATRKEKLIKQMARGR